MIHLSKNIGPNHPGLALPCMILAMTIPALAGTRKYMLGISSRPAMSWGLRTGISSISLPEKRLASSE